jgi:hypothetical protein
MVVVAMVVVVVEEEVVSVKIPRTGGEGLCQDLLDAGREESSNE